MDNKSSASPFVPAADIRLVTQMRKGMSSKVFAQGLSTTEALVSSGLLKQLVQSVCATVYYDPLEREKPSHETEIVELTKRNGIIDFRLRPPSILQLNFADISFLSNRY